MHQEREDLWDLAACLMMIPLVWLLYLGWDVARLTSSNDAVLILMPALKELMAQRGDWASVLYRPDFQGGVVMHDTFGMLGLPIYQLAGWLGLSPLGASNLAVFFVQLCFAYLSMRAVRDLGRLPELGLELPPEAQRPMASWIERIAMAALFSFLPVMGWRLINGHLNLAYGLLFFMALLALILAARSRRLNMTLLLMAFVSLIHAFQNNGQQALLYGAVFGGPILVGALWGARARSLPGTLAVPALIGISSVLVSVPKLWGMFAHVLSGDASRSLKGESVIHAYTTATFADWLSSIPLAHELIPSGREAFFQHETNYPMGPALLLLAAFLPWRRARALSVGLGASAILAMLFSMNIPPVSRVLPALIPPLHSFRVPARAILPFALTVPILAVAATLSRLRHEGRGAWWATGAVAGLVLLALPPTWREPLSWTLALALVVARLSRRSRGLAIPAGAALLMLAACHMAAFRERLLPLLDEELLVDGPRRVSARLLEQSPRLTSPLTRVVLEFNPGVYNINSGWMSGVSTFDGYWTPTRRFNELAYALEEQPPNATRMLFSTHSRDPLFPVYRSLYNICCIATETGSGLEVREGVGPTAGEAWFSAELSRLDSMQELARTLRAAGDDLGERLHLTAWVVSGDPAVRRARLALAPPHVCASSAVERLEAARGEQALRVRVRTEGACPLTLAMNYAQVLRAEGKDSSGARQTLEVFPAYGALTAVIVPAGVSEVIVRASPAAGAMALVAWLSGLLGFIVALLLTSRVDSRIKPDA